MANTNPWKARIKRWAKLWPVPIAELQAQAYGVLMVAHEGVAVDDDEQRRKNILAYFQGLTSFAKLLESAEIAALAERLTVLEVAAQSKESANGYHERRR